MKNDSFFLKERKKEQLKIVRMILKKLSFFTERTNFGGFLENDCLELFKNNRFFTERTILLNDRSMRKRTKKGK